MLACRKASVCASTTSSYRPSLHPSLHRLFLMTATEEPALPRQKKQKATAWNDATFVQIMSFLSAVADISWAGNWNRKLGSFDPPSLPSCRCLKCRSGSTIVSQLPRHLITLWLPEQQSQAALIMTKCHSAPCQTVFKVDLGPKKKEKSNCFLPHAVPVCFFI